MTKDSLLETLYAARRQLTLLIVRTAPLPNEEASLEDLLEARDRLVWTINRINLSELTASLAQSTDACDEIEAAVEKLKALTATVSNIDKALGITATVLNAASAVLGKI